MEEMNVTKNTKEQKVISISVIIIFVGRKRRKHEISAHRKERSALKKWIKMVQLKFKRTIY
jgi:hypothetical protein